MQGFLTLPISLENHSQRLDQTLKVVLVSAISILRSRLNLPFKVLGVDGCMKALFELDSHDIWQRVDFTEFHRDASNSGLLIFCSPALLFAEAPELNSIHAETSPSDSAWIVDADTREIHAWKKISKESGIETEELWCALTELTRCVGAPESTLNPPVALASDTLCLSMGTSMMDVHAAKCPPRYHASVYLQTALLEITSMRWPGKFEMDINRRLREKLEWLRNRSLVPWVFNAWLNEIEFSEGTIEPSSHPLEIHLSVTGLCNISCNFCTYTNEIGRRQYLSVDDILKLQVLKNIQVLRLNSGLGEPTLNPHLPEMIVRLHEEHPHLGMNFFSNGIPLHRPGLIEALCNRVDWINISLNATNRDSWKAQCGTDQFDRVTENLQKLWAAKREKKALLPVVFASMVINRHNLEDLPHMPEFCRNHGIDRISVFPYFALGYKTKFGPEDTLESCRDRYDELYTLVVEQARKHRISIELPAKRIEKTVTFGLETRRLYDFAGIERHGSPLSRFLVAWLESRKTNNHCHFLWRQAALGSTNNAGQTANATHYLYPCLGPLSGVDFSRVTNFDFNQPPDFSTFWRHPVLTRLRGAQHQRDVCSVCDSCRHNDSRDPKLFNSLEKLVGEFGDSIKPLERIV
jgi:MoaA/NifB/PqqE/SkfB family radical SAM enzyme